MAPQVCTPAKWIPEAVSLQIFSGGHLPCDFSILLELRQLVDFVCSPPDKYESDSFQTLYMSKLKPEAKFCFSKVRGRVELFKCCFKKIL